MSILIRGGCVYAPGHIYDPGAVLIEGSSIQAVGPLEDFAAMTGTQTIAVEGGRVIPGLVDLHLHGFGGFDVAGDGLAQVIRQLPAHGITSFLPTTVAAPSVRLLEALEVMADIIDHPPVGSFAAGIHMEGPWISRKRSGGIRAEYCYPITRVDAERHLAAAQAKVRMVTLAPEEGEALALIPWLTRQDVIVSLGHSDADYETVCKAVAIGLSHATHTYNAMRPLHQREPGALGAALERDEIIAQLIGDGFHVHPAAMRILVRLKGSGRVCLVSDAVFAAGLPPGQYEWDGRVLERIGYTCRFPDGAPAGSAMLVNQMLRVLVEQVGISFEEALRMGSETPAGVLGMRKGRLAPGYDADVVVLKEDYEPALTVIRGEIIYQDSVTQSY